jgi:microcystin-dependent protein
MADTYTPNLGLTLPEIGASRDTWGNKLNANTTTIDQQLGMAMPIGAMLDFAGPNAPSGWLICDGRLISRTTYAALFAVISTYWGAGDGSTTFALPSTPGRSSVGPGTVIDEAGNSLSYSFTQRLGVGYSQIAQAHLPALSLTTDTVAAHAHSGVTAPGGNHNHGLDWQGDHIHSTDVQGWHAHGGSTDAQGQHTHGYNQPNYQSGAGLAAGSQISTPTTPAQTDPAGNHAHNISTDTQGGHGHNLSTNGGHAHNVSYSGNLQLGIYADGSHSHAVALGGSGQWLYVRSPLICVTKIIFAGSQAALLGAVAAATAQRRLSAPLRGGMRGQLRLN